ncbi:hypothetical protein ILYODFUR_007962 [Ilyodon furcidens]|uniref:Secreted protein n=2 Tax=Goodeidae TaxID=28758 RepID=A0ABV0TT52_9TELE
MHCQLSGFISCRLASLRPLTASVGTWPNTVKYQHTLTVAICTHLQAHTHTHTEAAGFIFPLCAGGYSRTWDEKPRHTLVCIQSLIIAESFSSEQFKTFYQNTSSLKEL